MALTARSCAELTKLPSRSRRRRARAAPGRSRATRRAPTDRGRRACGGGCQGRLGQRLGHGRAEATDDRVVPTVVTVSIARSSEPRPRRRAASAPALEDARAAVERRRRLQRPLRPEPGADQAELAPARSSFTPMPASGSNRRATRSAQAADVDRSVVARPRSRARPRARAHRRDRSRSCSAAPASGRDPRSPGASP